MRAAQEFLKEKGIADIQGWIVSGASKRGMATMDIGIARCKTCPAKIIALAPIVPIVPDISEEVHRQWMSYGAFTWAFNDYIEKNITDRLDGPDGISMLEVFDPEYFLPRLEPYPKLIILSADDEFMMPDWPSFYWDKIPGEKHLLINPNADHVQLPGIYRALSAMGTFMRSIAAGHGPEMRPTFTQEMNMTTGEIVIRVPPQARKLKKVQMVFGQSVDEKRRDFRWIVKAQDGHNCTAPYLPLPIKIQEVSPFRYSHDFGIPWTLCLQPVPWLYKEI